MVVKYRVEGLGTALDALRDIGVDVKTMRRELRPAARTLATALRDETPKRSSALSNTVRPNGTVRQRSITAAVGSPAKPYATWLSFARNAPSRHKRFHNRALFGSLKKVELEITAGVIRIIEKHSRR